MALYVYETIPLRPGVPAERFEIWQPMRAAPLTKHSATGEPVRRIVIGGVGMPGSISDPKADAASAATVRLHVD